MSTHQQLETTTLPGSAPGIYLCMFRHHLSPWQLAMAIFTTCCMALLPLPYNQHMHHALDLQHSALFSPTVSCCALLIGLSGKIDQPHHDALGHKFFCIQ